LSPNCEGLGYSIRSVQSALRNLSAVRYQPSSPLLANVLDTVLPEESVDVVFSDPPDANDPPAAAEPPDADRLPDADKPPDAAPPVAAVPLNGPDPPAAVAPPDPAGAPPEALEPPAFRLPPLPPSFGTSLELQLAI